MGAYSIVDPALSEGRSNRLRNSHVELCPALQAQTIDLSRSEAKQSVHLRRQTVRPSLERGEGSSSIYTRFALSRRYSHTALVRPPGTLPRLLVATYWCSRSSQRDC